MSIDPEKIDEFLETIDAKTTSIATKRDYRIEQFETEVISTDNRGCLHESVIPKGYMREEYKPPAQPAITYKFTLDPFQRVSINCLEQKESVLVAAHTSAGKTVVAEYAIAMSLRDKGRVIYTSPIKALSNQKYRELKEKFEDVGLVTGDVTLNETASCLVMTTEILRSMLYRGSEVTREIAWVIFDEVHYMRDKERGVVWEETIILLSKQCKLVFLSATIPNATEFAEWICRIKKQPCNVVYTDYRPVPLQQFLLPAGANGIYLVVDEKGNFREENFQKAIGSLQTASEFFLPQRKKKPTEGADLSNLIKIIMAKSFDPCIIFSFSKREVEAYAMNMKNFDLTTADDKKYIEENYLSAMAGLAEEDRLLPQIQNMLPILKRGIGMHHGGLLPIVKEVIEILFQKNKLKILFSTETFSMGLNMPARTVVFTTVRKFDGNEFRWLTGGEYIQMSGRAGRRGLDDKGITIMMINEKMEPEDAKKMLKGQSDPLNSAFHLSYAMLINSLRLEDSDPEYIIRRSFFQHQNDRKLPEKRHKLAALASERNALVVPRESTVAELAKLHFQEVQLEKSIWDIVIRPENIVQYLNIGRLVYIKLKDLDYGWGVVINFNKTKMNVKSKKGKVEGNKIIVDVLLPIKTRTDKNEQPQPAINEDKIDVAVEVIPMMLECVRKISSVRLTLPTNLQEVSNKMLVFDTLKKIDSKFKGAIPLLDPIKDMGIHTSELDELSQKINSLVPLRKKCLEELLGVDVETSLRAFEKKESLTKEIQAIAQDLENCSGMVLEVTTSPIVLRNSALWLFGAE